MTTRTRTAIPLLVGAVIALLPGPPGLAPYAWRYFAVFAATIVALITEPLPAAAVGLISVTFTAALGLPFSPEQRADPSFRFPAEALRWSLAGFINPTVWLIFAAFVFAMGYQRTGLGRRIALLLVRRLGVAHAGARVRDRPLGSRPCAVHPLEYRAQRRDHLSRDCQHPAAVRLRTR